MDTPIERLAELSVARGCGFALIGIVTTMTGLSAEPALAFKAGGILTLLTCAVLLLKAFNALGRPYKRTEVWIMLNPDERPPEDVAPRMVAEARRSILLRWTERSAWISAALLTGAVAAMISR